MSIKPAEIQVRFADLDVLGHVNNSIYLSYFEMTRVHYFKELLGESWDWKKNGVLLVRNEIDYLEPILLHQKPSISMYLIEIGNKSFKLGYEIFVEEKIHTKGCSVMVCFDSVTNQTSSVPIEMKKALNILKRNL
ncbi:MAG: acyl-CoA thioesterase [Bacteroidetes bacterium]|nr:acyl-CoA thioesterase [Bacteroidota bacterium]